MDNSPKKKNVIGLIGFGISLAVFVLELLTLVARVVASHSEESSAAGDRVASIMMLLFIIGMLGLVFSIAGVITARNDNTPSWPGVWGVILCVSCILLPSFISLLAIIFFR